MPRVPSEYRAMMDRGARCLDCPLYKHSKPVPSEIRPGTSSVTFVAQCPGREETEEGRPLVGPSGQELARAMKHTGWVRTMGSYLNVCACEPPGDLTTFLKKLQAKNRQRKKKGIDPIPTPMECCAGRFRRDLSESPHHIVALGGHAVAATVPSREGDARILKVRGHKFDVDVGVDGRPAKVFPTVNPAFVMRQRRWTHVFYRDLQHARDWFSGAGSWKPPHFVNGLYRNGEVVRDRNGDVCFQVPNLQTVRDYLRGSPRFWEGGKPRWMVYDVETDGIRMDRTNIRCVGVSGTDHVLVIPFLSVDGLTRYYPPEIEAQIVEELRIWANDRTILKVGHNAGSFDRMRMEEEWDITPEPLLDTVLVHKSVDAELPHDLGFVGSFYTPVHAWKLDKDNGWNTDRDFNLWEYNGLDCVVNARVLVPIVAEARRREQLTGPIPTLDGMSAHVSRDSCTRDHAMQHIGVGMGRTGIWVDQAKRAEKEREALEKVAFWRNRARMLLESMDIDEAVLADAGVDVANTSEEQEELEGYQQTAEDLGLAMDEFNPASHVQVRKLLFYVWALPEPEGLGRKDLFTDTGAYRTGKAVLQAYMTDDRLSGRQQALVHSCYMYRMWAKRYGTYARPTRYAPFETKPKCVLYPDGRVHPIWNAGGTLVGRYSNSGGLNVQAVPFWFKACLAADHEQGHVMVGADVDQFHLRIIGHMWEIPSLLKVFENPALDPHSVFAETVLGDTFRQAKGYAGYGLKPKKGTPASKMRDMAKTMRYAGAYAAKPPTIYRVMRGLVDEEGRLVNRKLTPQMVEVMHAQWMEAEPEWEAAWNKHIAEWKQQGYLASPLLGRRRYFLDQKETDVVNYPILSAEGDIFGEITQRVVDAIPHGKWGPGTGLVNQVHDALYVECPAAVAEEVQHTVTECMHVKIPEWRVEITGAADIGTSMADVAA